MKRHMAYPGETSLGRAFRLSEAVHLLVSAFARTGVPVDPSAAVLSLQSEFPNISEDELLKMLREAAAEQRANAGIAVEIDTPTRARLSDEEAPPTNPRARLH
jgi:hypothetical protein